ncbi:hypothetical protein ACIBCN_38240 [Nocardia sp. NPDC051052]|uniref:WXG100-like domain-containing protein n=1 Tax=Nocardia sp. NPDC051052 TaxID=3364322 RepID=UPI003789F048
MSMDLPEDLRWLGWIAGSTWPDGDEDAMWAIAAAWKTASQELKAQLAHIDTAKQGTVRAYPQGHAAEEMGHLFDGLRSGDQSLESLAQYLEQISDSTFDLGTQLQATKLTIVISLVWLAMEILWAWMFPPTAPAVEAAAVTTTRSFLRVFEDMVQKMIQNLARKLGASAEKRYFWKTLAGGRFVLPTAKGWGVYGVKFAETAVTSGGLNAAVQLGQMADGKRRHFDGKEFGVSVFASVASALPSREFARYLGNGIDKLAGRQLNNVWGRTGRGAFIGAGAGVVGSASGNLAVGVATGDWSSFTTPQGWVGGAARGGLVGGARGAFAKSSPISRSDVRYPLWMHKPGSPRTPPSNAASRGSSVHDGSTRSSGGSSIEMQSLNSGGRGGSGSRGSEVSGGRSVQSSSHRTGSAPSAVRSEGSSRGTGSAPSVMTSVGGSQNSHSAPVVTNGSGSHQGPPSVNSGGSTGSGRSDGGSRGTLDSDGRSFHSDRGTLDSQGRSFHTGRGTLDSQGQSFHTARESYRTAQESLGGDRSSAHASSGDSQPSVRGSSGGTQSSVHGSSGDQGSTGSGRSSGRNGFVPPTSWEASVDGGWQPPAGRGALVEGTAPSVSPLGSSVGGETRSVSPIPGSPMPSGSVGDRSSTSGASGSGAAITHPPSTAPSRDTGSTHSRGNTNPPVPPDHHRAAPPDPFLGASKDMKAKTRPKRLPYWEPLPGVFHAPEAPDARAWVFGDEAEDDLSPEGTGEGVDVPFTLNR